MQSLALGLPWLPDVPVPSSECLRRKSAFQVWAKAYSGMHGISHEERGSSLDLVFDLFFVRVCVCVCVSPL